MGHTAMKTFQNVTQNALSNYLLENFRQIKENYFKLVVDRVLEILGLRFLEVR